MYITWEGGQSMVEGIIPHFQVNALSNGKRTWNPTHAKTFKVHYALLIMYY